MAVEAIAAILTLLALGALFYGPWQWVCTDMARQVVFEKRDAIFDIAARGDLDFDSPEYRNIRGALEKTIRYAHDLTVPYFVYAIYMHKLRGKTVRTELFSAVNAIENDELRREISAHIAQAFAHTIAWTLLRSAIGLLVIVPLLVGARVFASVKRRLFRLSEIVQAEAEAADRINVAST